MWQDHNTGVVGEAAEGSRQKPPGPEEVKVPNVKSLTEQEVRERLTEAGFQAKVWPRKSPKEDAGRVLEQSTPDAKEAEEGSKIFLTVG